MFGQIHGAGHAKGAALYAAYPSCSSLSHASSRFVLQQGHSKSQWPAKIYTPRKMVSRGIRVWCKAPAILSGCGIVRRGPVNGETVKNGNRICRFLTINLFYTRTQSKSAPLRQRQNTINMVNGIKRFAYSAISIVFLGVSVPLYAAEIVSQGTLLTRENGGVALTLSLNDQTPFKTFTLDNPRRLVVDLGETGLMGMPEGLASDIPEVSALRYGLFQLGQSRIVLDLATPMVIETALATDTANNALINIRLKSVSAEEFAVASVNNRAALWQPEQLEATVSGGAGLPLIAIDAGHGGLDNGARQDGVSEKDIALQMANLLRDVLLEDGGFRVILTRESDIYIPLGERVEIARRAGAWTFISLHADIVTLGRARGTTVFSLSEAGESQQAVTIATLENRSDLVAGISVEGEDDQLTQVLLQLAHRETDAFSNRFADTMAEAMWFQNDTEIKSRRMAGGFRVLRAPDIPSVLIELGFMSDKTDFEKLQNPEWQRSMAETLRDGLRRWLQVEEDMRGLLRN